MQTTLGENIQDSSFLRDFAVEFDRGTVHSIVSESPGAGLYIGQILEDVNELDSAHVYYEIQFYEQDPIYSERALQKLLSVLAESGRYEEIIEYTNIYFNSFKPDPLRTSWAYTHRFEALIQENLKFRAYREIQALVREYPYLFTETTLPHGLLYYRAFIASQVVGIRDLNSHILPYTIISNARSGHNQIFEIVHERFAQSPGIENIEAYNWLRLKSLLIENKYSEALDEFIILLESPREYIYELSQVRPQEGIAFDLFIAGANSNRREEAILLFEKLQEGIPQDSHYALLLSAQYTSYSARLLHDLNRNNEAVTLFAEAFSAIREYRNGLERISTNTTVLASVSRMQELMLWRWVGAILSNESSNSNEYSALLFVRNPDFFYDILDEYLSTLVRQYKFDDLASFLTTFSDDSSTTTVFPRSLVISSSRILDSIAHARRNRDQNKDAFVSANSTTNAGSLLDRALLFMNLEVTESTLHELFALQRSVSFVDSGISSLPLSDKEIVQYNEILSGYGMFGLYQEAREYLDSLPTNYEADPEMILSIAEKAYSENDWYGGLRLIEGAIWRTYAFGDGPKTFIDSAGGVEELLRYLFPEAWAEWVERYARQYNINPYFYIALMREESRFNARAGSHAGALGLGQIIPATANDIARQLGMEEYNLFDPNDNIHMSLFYISQLAERFSTVWEILSGYNAGPGRVRKWNSELPQASVSGVYYLSHVPFEETRNYMRRVINSFLMYDYLYCRPDTAAEIHNEALLSCNLNALSIHQNTIHGNAEEINPFRYTRMIHGEIIP